jgi:hypothetical protein
MAKQKKPKASPQPQPATKQDIADWLELATAALTDARYVAGSLGLRRTKYDLEQTVAAAQQANDTFASELRGEAIVTAPPITSCCQPRTRT